MGSLISLSVQIETAKTAKLCDEPGRLVILPAPGLSYMGQADQRPLHGVNNVVGGRLSIGFRQAQDQLA